MLVDSHVHLQPHGAKPPVTQETIERYVELARAHGLDGIAITEHLFRFREAYALLAGWWDADPQPQLAAATAAYWRDHVSLSLSEYVALVEEAKSRGLPVALGLELDWIPGKAEVLRRLLAPYAWDVVLGSVHWIGAFGFDIDDQIAEWSQRDPDDVFSAYAQLIAEMAASGLADVLAHVDLPKLWRHRPRDPAAFHGRLLAAAMRGGCAIEINTNGLRKPVAELYPNLALLEAAGRAGVPITLGSDAHTPERLGEAFDVAIAAARTAGYTGYVRFGKRQPLAEPFPSAPVQADIPASPVQ